MNEIPFHTTLTLPVRTYLRTMSGNACFMYWSQPGHWRSANSYIVTGAFALPSVPPSCGMPASSLFVAATDASLVGDEDALVLDDELSTLASTRISAIRPAAPMTPA